MAVRFRSAIAARALGRSRLLSTLAGPSAAPSGPLAPYTALVSRGRLLPDDSQLSAAQQLERFATGADSTDGVYLWGSVGSGKTLLMDLFVGSCDNHPAAAVSRWHFHELMLDIHGRLHAMQAARPRKIVRTKLGLPVYKYLDEEEPKSAIDSDERAEDAAASDGEATAEAAAEETAPPSKASVPLERVIAQLASQSRILCLDEFQVTDVADAMLLRQLFEGLFDAGVKVIFTSNRPPEDLYERGLNRAYFIPFVALLRERCAVVRVGGSNGGDDAIDYRSLPPPTEKYDFELAGDSGGAADDALPAASRRVHAACCLRVPTRTSD